MASTDSIDIRILAAAGVTTAATVLAYLVGSSQPSGSPADATALAATAQAATPAAATIAMAGTGEVTGVPDQVTFSLTVRAHASDVTAALDSANATTRDVLASVRAHGVDAEDVQTTGLSLHPTYDSSGEGPRVLTGYQATQTLSVLVAELTDAGSTMSAAVEAGGNAVRLGDVHLQIGDEDALLARARDAAFAEAQAKAQQYAEAAGRPLGEVTSVREVHASSTQPRSLEYARFAAADALSDVPIRAGSQDLDVTVSVVWSFA